MNKRTLLIMTLAAGVTIVWNGSVTAALVAAGITFLVLKLIYK